MPFTIEACIKYSLTERKIVVTVWLWRVWKFLPRDSEKFPSENLEKFLLRKYFVYTKHALREVK